MKKIVLFMCGIFMLQAVPAQAVEIVALVNKDIISDYDLRVRSELLKVINPAAKEAPRAELERKALLDLINEKVKASLVKKNGIRITNKQVQGTKKNIIKGKNPFKNFAYGEEVYDNYLRTQMAWMQLVQGQISPSVNIDDDDLKDYIQTLKKTRGEPSTLVLSQIIVPTEDKVMTVYDNVKDIKNCRTFNEKAALYGESGSGDMGGRIDSQQLAGPLQQLFTTAPLRQALKPMPIGQGYIIFMVCSRSGKNFFNRPKIKKQIQVSLLNQKVEIMAEQFLADERRKVFVHIKSKKYQDVMNAVY